MKLILNTGTTSKFEVDVDLTFSVRRVKEIIKDKHGIPVDEQRIIYMGRPLEDNKTLKDYKIHSESCLHFVFRSKCTSCHKKQASMEPSPVSSLDLFQAVKNLLVYYFA